MDAENYFHMTHTGNRHPESAERRRDLAGKDGFTDRRAPLKLPLMGRLPVAAFCCDLAGAVVSHNEAAADLWGRAPDPADLAQWDGACVLFDLEGRRLQRSDLPAAQAVANGLDGASCELWLERPDGTRRRVENHAKIARAPDGTVAGAFCVLVDNTERARLAEELSRRDSDKDAFLSLLAHELRNPLAPILSAAHVMRKVSADDRICGMADIVERQVKQLSRFVSDLLDASNLAEGGIVLKPSAVTLGSVVACALDELYPHARARGQRVAVDFADHDKTAFCDPQRAAQALANVMLNASAFTGEGGDISVQVRVDCDLLEVEVTDSGIGIDPGEIDEVFKPYSQFATHGDRLRSGVGLGLAIAKEICEGHGGQISATSPGRGQGSRFRIMLPVIQAPA